MKAFRSVTAKAAVIDRPDVDTDQIIPKQFLKRIERTGYGEFLFYDWRQDPDFELNRPESEGAKILLTGSNFGCGSSREHAAWALQDFGFDVVVAPSFGDIFFSNSVQVGLVPVTIPAEELKRLMEWATGGDELTVDLEAETITAGTHDPVPFSMDPFVRNALLNGLDAIGRTLQHEAEIAAFEERVEPRFATDEPLIPTTGSSPSRVTSRFVRSRSSQKSSRRPSVESGPRLIEASSSRSWRSRSGSTNGMPFEILYCRSSATSSSRAFTASTIARSRSEISARRRRTVGSEAWSLTAARLQGRSRRGGAASSSRGCRRAPRARRGRAGAL